ncbi:UNVERIFIED_CONTAM: hypothetical protein HDU68_004191, partial [Siphonaria sp. JEL0065]
MDQGDGDWDQEEKIDLSQYQDDTRESRYLTVIITLLEEMPDGEHHQFSLLLQNAKELLATMALNKLNNTFDTITKNRVNTNNNDWQQLLVDVRSFMLYSGNKLAANKMLMLLSQAGMDANDPFVRELLMAKPKAELPSLVEHARKAAAAAATTLPPPPPPKWEPIVEDV